MISSTSVYNPFHKSILMVTKSSCAGYVNTPIDNSISKDRPPFVQKNLVENVALYPGVVYIVVDMDHI